MGRIEEAFNLSVWESEGDGSESFLNLVVDAHGTTEREIAEIL
jgi:hypothetical protein